MNRKENKKTAQPSQEGEQELSTRHLGLRLAAILLFLVVGAVAIANGVNGLLSAGSGWQQIEANGGAGLSCASELLLAYDLGRGAADATVERKLLTSLYTEAAVKCYQVFNTSERFEGVGNLCALNQSPNTPVQVDPLLYQSLAQLAQEPTRSLYLGPVYAVYFSLFRCASDAEAALYDAATNESVAQYFAEVCAFAMDPEAITLELLGENRVQLTVSKAYLAFAEENAITEFLDFSWMKNAFVVDYIAGVLAENGLTNGYLSSYDGFTRNLDTGGAEYNLNLYQNLENTLYLAGRLQYAGPMSLVCLRNFQVDAAHELYYYQFATGECRYGVVDGRTGLNVSAVNSLLGYSPDAGCAEILVRLLPVYAAETLDVQALRALAQAGVQTLYLDGQGIYASDPAVAVTDLYQSDALGFALNGLPG